MKSSIRKMLTAAGGPIKKIKTRDINGNWVYMDISTGRTTSAGPETGTIRTNAVNSVGGDVKTKQGRTKIALKQATSYNNRLYKVHNYANTTTRLKLKHQDVVLDKQGEPKIVLTDYTPASEAPMSGADPLLSFYVGGVGLKGIGALAKTGLWNIAKYAPTTLLGNYGRQYFVGDVFKNSFNGTTPMLTPQTISLLYLPTKQNESGLISLKFFERKPSRISEAESLGFGKSRGFNPNFGDDIHLYYILKDRRLTILDAIRKLKAPEDMGVDETISKNSGAILDDGELVSNGYHNTPVSEKYFFTESNMSFGRLGVSGNGHNYGLNLAGIATRVPDLNTNSKIVYSRPGANLDNSDVVVTTFDNIANKKGILLITKGMKDMESGAEFSGDASSTTAAEALYTWLRIAKNKPALRETAMNNAKKVLKSNEGIPLGTHSVSDPIHKIYTENATMSPDAYSYIYRTAANNPDKFHLGYQMNAGNFNSFARNPKNAYMYDIEQNYLNGLITPQEYIKLFNSWSAPLGGRRAYFYNGQIYKPQPFLIRNKQGGKVSKHQLGNAINTNWWKSPNWKSPSQQVAELWTTEETEKVKKPVKKSTKLLNSAKTKDVKSINTRQKRIKYERDWSDDFEPWALGIGLAGDVVGLTTASSGVGVPAGALIATAANLPSLGIDIYLTGRDLYRYYNDNNPEALTSGLWNGAETTLDLLGLKLLSKLNKGLKAGVHSERTLSASEKALSKPYHRVGTGAGRAMAKRSRNAKVAYNVERQKALKEATEVLAKRGVRPSQGEYFMKYLTDEMAKRGYGVSVADAIRSQKQAQLFNYGLNSAAGAAINIYDIYNLKQGGKMNTLLFLKNGNGIHIKKKNRGKFTDYCGGKVTDACIRRAKASGNPTLVKRATFAANARKWKH